MLRHKKLNVNNLCKGLNFGLSNCLLIYIAMVKIELLEYTYLRLQKNLFKTQLKTKVLQNQQQ